MRKWQQMDSLTRQYLLVTFNYWNFTVTDGALRMLVVLYFHQLGYDTLQIAALFLFYELFGVVTNLIGGWLGARLGLNRTMNIGLALQIVSLIMLAAPTSWLTMVWVMAAQALSGIAKDLNKMSAKSAVKSFVTQDQQGTLYRWVALLTGSKNALKGFGFFAGGLLLSLIGFRGAVLLMAAILAGVLLGSLIGLKKDLGKAKKKPKFSEIFSKSRSVNILSAARLFLFGARDVWFVVALPVYLGSVFAWDYMQVGGFIAVWVIGYGVVQGIAPRLTGKHASHVPDGKAALGWACLLSVVTIAVALGITYQWYIHWVVTLGLLIFGAVFAINSSLHSYLIVSYASEDGVSLDIGFYYMANALGRLIGTVLSGSLFLIGGLALCLWASVVFLLLTSLISLWLPRHQQRKALD
ncbi:organoarsenical effux MFS transporter ArsJ [Vibrio sp. CAIM 722]|uniref:Organoarsenical effux MFS transporter ArsJ n=1 Tax=Vibrio eleionomae TaxID=2653505 RepID=A0A7X4RVF6_9VIBR|nr:organoarsenical effux MFS transporter ArsJ [Vibrio eleionomae]MZI94493.1 organoarsenical effux MFS transporter ArsJ [Vibrio eleionomae]